MAAQCCAMSPGIFQRENRENQTGMFGTIATQYIEIETIWFWKCNKGELENDSGQLCMVMKSAGCVWLHEEIVKTGPGQSKTKRIVQVNLNASSCHAA